MKKGLWKNVLSGVIAVAVMLGVFVPQIAEGATEVYFIQPVSSSLSGTASEVSQSVIATCDTIRDTVWLFNGAPRESLNFTLVIQDSASGATIGTYYAPPDSKGFRWVKFGGVNASVTRGKTYYFKFSHPSQINYYYDTSNVYKFGRLTLGLPQQKDLAARIMGSSRVGADYWGTNFILAYRSAGSVRDTAVQKAKGAGIRWGREEFAWRAIADSIQDSLVANFNWAKNDSAMRALADTGVVTLGLFAQPPHWAEAAINNTQDTPMYPPKKLYEPVLVGDSINPQNWFGYYVYQVVKRYGSKRVAGTDTFGLFWYRNGSLPYQPVLVWDIWNEPNLRMFWEFPNDNSYPWINGSHENLAKLYVRLVAVADSAIAKADPNGKVFACGVSHMFGINGDTTGYHWLKWCYQWDGNRYWDGLAVHLYQMDGNGDGAKTFRDTLFRKDLDSLGALMRRGSSWGSDAGKEVWIGELGWTATRSCGMTVEKQADNLLKSHAAGLGDDAARRSRITRFGWWEIRDIGTDTGVVKNTWGILNSACTTPKPAYYALKQANGKLKDKYFNRRVPLGNPSDRVFCYEFEDPGTGKRTWAVWKDTLPTVKETLSIRTGQYDSLKIAYSANPDSGGDYSPTSGRLVITADVFPKYFREQGTISRPDIIVDSLWLVPSSPRAGEGVRFYARIKNISKTDSLRAGLADTVIFQVDGVTKVRYAATRGLDTLGGPKDTLTVGYLGFGPTPDWYANYGDHLIRAWVDSSDKFVELREDNNTGYIFKHIRPKVSLIINNNHKYSNHLANDTLSVVMDGNTTPLPDSAKLLHEGSWTRLGVYGPGTPW